MRYLIRKKTLLQKRIFSLYRFFTKRGKIGNDFLHVYVKHDKEYENVSICLQLDVDIYLKLCAENCMAYPEIPTLVHEKMERVSKSLHFINLTRKLIL